MTARLHPILSTGCIPSWSAARESIDGTYTDDDHEAPSSFMVGVGRKNTI